MRGFHIALAALGLLVCQPAFAAKLITVSFESESAKGSFVYDASIAPEFTSHSYGDSESSEVYEAYYSPVLSAHMSTYDNEYPLNPKNLQITTLNYVNSALLMYVYSITQGDPEFYLSLQFDPVDPGFYLPDRMPSSNYSAFLTYGDPSSGMFYRDDNVSISFATAVPELSSWALMIIGIGAIGACLRRQRSQKRAAGGYNLLTSGT